MTNTYTIKEYGSIRLHNFFGQLDIGVEKPFKIISIDKNDPWLREVFDTAIKYAETDEQKPAVWGIEGPSWWKNNNIKQKSSDEDFFQYNNI